MYMCMHECVCLCVPGLCVHARLGVRFAPLAEGGGQDKTRSVAKCLKGEAMSLRGPHVSKCASVCVGMGLQRRAGQRTEPESFVVQISACVQGAMWHRNYLGGHAPTWVCRLTHVFQLTAGAEMDNQEGRESGSACTSVGKERSFVTRIWRDSVLLCMMLHERVMFF